MFGNAPFSYSSRGLSQDEPPQQRWGVQQDDMRSSPLQRSSMSRPSGKFIYKQRKDYSETLNSETDNFHYRVEHLFTCEMDGNEIKSPGDCVAKLKRLDTKGRLWPQDMIIEIQRGHLQLNDIETKAELESIPLDCILQTTAVLDSCAYNSLLTITVQERSKRSLQVYIFQCEEIGAEHIRGDLDKMVQNRGADVEPQIHKQDISAGGFQSSWPRPSQQKRSPSPPNELPSFGGGQRWPSRDPENALPPVVYPPREPANTEANISRNMQRVHPQTDHSAQEADRNTDIFNHILNDVEIFMAHVLTPPEPTENNSKKKKSGKKKKSSKTNAPATNLPSWEEYISCLQKIKYGFNLLGNLNGVLDNPSAPDFIHILFSCVSRIMPQYPPDLPPTVLTPLLTEQAIGLLAQEVTPEEDQLWTSLGDAWNIPRSKWPDGNMIPPYYPEFYDGWQPTPLPSPSSYRSPPMSRSSNMRYQAVPQNGPMGDSQGYEMPRQPDERTMNSSRGQQTREQMCVIYDFMARNSHELDVMKGEIVEVIDKSKQWWLVRNSRKEEGHIPQNVLEPMNGHRPMEDHRHTQGAPSLDMRSSPADVMAWLQYKRLSKITVRSLGVLNGKQLLEMTRDQMRAVCPEEGGKVFFQLQAIKSAVALASEPGFSTYNGY